MHTLIHFSMKKDPRVRRVVEERSHFFSGVTHLFDWNPIFSVTAHVMCTTSIARSRVPFHRFFISFLFLFHSSLLSPPPLLFSSHQVDGRLSIDTYLDLLDVCYDRFRDRFRRTNGEDFQIRKHADYLVFHSPFARLTRKAFARLIYLDYLNDPDSLQFASLRDAGVTPRRESFQDKQLERTFLSFSSSEYDCKVAPSTLASRRVGNLASGSVWAGLLSLLSLLSFSSPPLDREYRIVVYSYGSGSSSSLFSFVFSPPLSKEHFPSFVDRLDARVCVNPIDFFGYFDGIKERGKGEGEGECEKPSKEVTEEEREGKGSVFSKPSSDFLSSGSFYLHHTDQHNRRFYEKSD